MIMILVMVMIMITIMVMTMIPISILTMIMITIIPTIMIVIMIFSTTCGPQEAPGGPHIANTKETEDH